MKFELGVVIAERILSAVNREGVEFKVCIFLGAPSKIPDSLDIYTPYRIEYNNKSRTWYAAGIDGFQSLQLAMRMIAVELDSLSRDYGMKLLWHGNADIGFKS